MGKTVPCSRCHRENVPETGPAREKELCRKCYRIEHKPDPAQFGVKQKKRLGWKRFMQWWHRQFKKG